MLSILFGYCPVRLSADGYLYSDNQTLQITGDILSLPVAERFLKAES